MKDELKRYLEDIVHSISMVEEFRLSAPSFSQYESNAMLKSAVQWQLSVIGEALNNALKMEPTLTITNARKVVDMRNKLIHGYDDVEDNVVWNVIVKHLPLLKAEIDQLLHSV
jgi:uncharacterized protein with HEPN domain